jgi:hypothetical protein
MFDWPSMSAALLAWSVLVALVGYAAVLAAWRMKT